MATLELQGLRKSFGLIDVLHGIDLTLADGEMLVIVGASGCGKSTLLRLVAGLERPTAGRVVLGGRDVTQPRSVRARHRHGVPELRALSAHDRVRQHGLRPAHPRPRRATRSAGGWTRRRRCSVSVSCWRASRGSFPAASASAWRWAGRSCATRSCSCSTSRCPTWTPSCGSQMRAEIRRLQRRLGRHQPVRHPRPGGGDDAGRPSAGAAPGPAGAARHADGGVRAPGRHLCRRLHRRADDEFPARRAGARRDGGATDGRATYTIRRWTTAGRGRARPDRRHPAGASGTCPPTASTC